IVKCQTIKEKECRDPDDQHDHENERRIGAQKILALLRLRQAKSEATPQRPEAIDNKGSRPPRAVRPARHYDRLKDIVKDDADDEQADQKLDGGDDSLLDCG
ncbi:MAG: hypothetical protein M3347_16500, partial [Armatimonadota bacterium]|nr:hypothetical protein [Armatimonadota bacterium]